MCEKCKPVPGRKIFWLDQLKEMEYSAKKIAETLYTTNERLQIEINLYNVGHYKSKKELEVALLETIKDITTPREKPGPKHIQKNLFQ